MKAIFYLFVLLGLFACGQKGPLYLVDEPVESKKIDAPIDNPNAKITPDWVTFKALTVSGQKAQVERNIAGAWEKLLVPLRDSNNLIRYVVFNQSIEQGKAPFTMLVGYVQKKNIQGQISQSIDAGSYLRFSGVERGADQIPTLLNRIKEYFSSNPNIRHGKNKDFLVENKGLIEVYISVEKTQK